MLRMTAVIMVVIGVLASASWADDLYRVTVSGPEDVRALKSPAIDPLISLQSGYLVLAAVDPATLGLDAALIATNISRDELATDLRMDRLNAERLELLLEVEALRLYRLSPAQLATAAALQVRPVGQSRPRIVSAKSRPITLAVPSQAEAIGLDSLIKLVKLDSLETYVETLQAFNGRVVGTASNTAARNWIRDKFESFDLDSVVYDPFVAQSTNMANIYAVKLGTRFPEFRIVIGAHYDAVPGSPGADDNGSGSAGVIEMARVIANLDTDMTFVFICFDGEEVGLFGSEHYAERAENTLENIVFMLNMDMTGHFDNTNRVKLYNGSDASYSQRFRTLGSSLLGLSSTLAGTSGSSDHYPFQTAGYPVTFVQEYNFSTVYHSPQDSTTYMSFDYMTKLVKNSLATAYYVDGTEGPDPALAFAYPDGLPISVFPEQPNTVRVTLESVYYGEPVPNSGRVYYRPQGGSWQNTLMTPLSLWEYEATLPAIECGEYIDYYFAATEQSSGTFYGPSPSTPQRSYGAYRSVAVLDDSFETDQGWTLQGWWGRGVPTGQRGDHGGPDPTSGFTTPSVLGYNLHGGYTDSTPPTHATSPAMDLTGLYNTQFVFYRWLGVEDDFYDHAYVYVSTNGTDWTQLWTNTDEVNEFAWTRQAFDISAIADNQPEVYVRFTMGWTDYQWNWCGWNVDDVEVVGMQCDLGPDTDGDGFPDLIDNCPLVYNPLQEDNDDDGVGNACCCTGPSVGNVDGSSDEAVTMGDLTVLIDHLFISYAPLPCPLAGNVDMSGDGAVTMGDLTVLIDNLFISYDPLPACP